MMGAAGTMGGCGTSFGSTKLCVSDVGQQVWSELNMEYLSAGEGGCSAGMGQDTVGRRKKEKARNLS